MKNVRFYCLRYWLVDNLFTHPLSEQQKNKRFVSQFFKTRDVKVLSHNYKIKMILQKRSYLLGQFGKDVTVVHPTDTGEIIEDQADIDTPWVYFYVDSRPGVQLIYIQIDSKKQVYSGVRRIMEILDSIAEQSGPERLDVTFEYLPSEDTFWPVYKTFDQVRVIQFTFLPPNFMGAEEEVTDIAASAKRAIGAKKTEVTYKNKEGLDAELHNEFLEGQVRHTETKSGSWRIAGLKGKRYVSKRKEDYAKTHHIDIDEDIDHHELLDLLIAAFESEAERA